MIRLLPFTICVFLCLQAFTQQGQITIDQDARIAKLLKVYKSVNNKKGYYQIQVGFKSNDVAAQELHDQVKIDFPGWPTEIKFREPTYRIRVGRYSDRLEAERKYLEVRKKYPNAMLLKLEDDSKQHP